MSKIRSIGMVFAVAGIFTLCGDMVNAQAAGADAKFNKADRKEVTKQREIDRLKKVDPPIRPDPIGNALVGGAVTGVVTGSATAAAASVVTRTTVQAATNKAKEEKKSK